jgi:ferredoxin--NADP+ reductase
MLVLAPSELAPTDTADHALDVLAHSTVTEVIVAGRRGPAQAAFTNPELRELADLADADIVVDPQELETALAVSDPDTELTPTAQRNVELLRNYASTAPSGRSKRIVLRFLLSPTALLAGDAGPTGHLSAVEFVRNRLVPGPGGGLRAQATDERETIPTGLVFRAIGYRGIPLPGVPFDERAATIPHNAGRVLHPTTGAPLPGEYVVGWIKRGPSGVIGTNKKDAQETVDAIFADIPATDAEGQSPAPAPAHIPDTPDPDAIEALLRARQPALVTYSGWEAIDRHERSLGEPSGRPRVKLTRIDELLQVAASERPSS